MQTVKANGAELPIIGLGTWQLRGEICSRIVAQALSLGYRHLDTAQAYENEQDVGDGLRASGIPRDSVWITTKVWFDRFRDGALQRSAEQSAERLGTVPDLLLLHWPNPAVPLQETVRALCAARRLGLTRHIGVSNFTVALVDRAAALSDEPLVLNQVEYHPYLDQGRVISACRRHGMGVTAYSPIAKGAVADDRVIRDVASAHSRTPAQVALRWLIQQGVIAIPRSSKEDRLSENLDVFGFELSEDEMRRISGRARPNGRLVSPAWAPAWD